MIKFFNDPITESLKKDDTPYQEGFMKDVLNSVEKTAEDGLGINVNGERGVKEQWKDAGDDLADKTKVVADTAGKVAQKARGKLEDEEFNKNNRIDSTSIIAKAKKSTLIFSVYASQTSGRISEIHIITKMLEKVYASYVQAAIAQDPILDEEEANRLVFLKKYHTNVNEAVAAMVNEFYQPIDFLDEVMKESVYNVIQLNEKCSVEFSFDPVKDNNLITECRRLCSEPLEGFSYLMEADNKEEEKKVETETTSSKNDQKDTRHIQLSSKDIEDLARNRMSGEQQRYSNITNNEISDRANAKYPQAEKLPKDADLDKQQKWHKKEEKRIKDRNEFIKSEFKKREEAKEELSKKIDEVKNDIQKGNMKTTDAQGNRGTGSYHYDNGRYYRTDTVERNVKTSTTKPKQPEKPEKEMPKPVDRYPDTPALLRSGDVKKLNGMDPYQIKCTFRIKTATGVDKEMSYLLGVKTQLHIITAQDLANDLEELIMGNIKSIRKVKYKTGEIGLLDYLFNIKGLKSDAAKRATGSKRWISSLKRLADYSKTHGALLKKPAEFLNGGTIPRPNATLILSQGDVVMLMNQTGIDLSKVSNAMRLARNLFLIAIIIVDSSAGSMKVLFPDETNSWDVQSLSSIDAEVSKTDNSKVMNELNKLVNH